MMNEMLSVMEMLELNDALELLHETIKKTNSMSYVAFTSFYSMLLEEYCLANELDMIDTLTKLLVVAKEVDKDLGKYNG